jgi:RNA polymerase sigma-70 factor (ECF subfamily)
LTAHGANEAIPFAEDFSFALACMEGDGASLKRLESLCRSELRLALRRMRAPVDEDETTATLLAKLLVAKAGSKPKLGQYEGQSKLRSWIRVVAVHHVLKNLLKTKRLVGREEPLNEALLAEIDRSQIPEWRTMDSAARQAFKEALARALESLTSRNRNLLRHRLDDLTVTEIAALYKVSHVTVLRWLAQIGSQVRQAVLGELRDALRLKAPELESLVHSLLGRVDSSVRVEVSRAFRDGRK